MKKIIKIIIGIIILISLSGCEDNEEYDYPSMKELNGYWQYYSSPNYYLLANDKWALYDDNLVILNNGTLEYNRDAGYLILYSDEVKYDSLTILNSDIIIDDDSKKLYKYEYSSN